MPRYTLVSMFEIELILDRVFGTNNGYFIFRGFRKKKNEVEQYEKLWFEAVSHCRRMFSSYDYKREYLTMDITWYNPKFYKKNGTMSKTAGDTDGVVKFIKDGICNGIGVNDAFVKRESIVQLPSENEKHLVRVTIDCEPISSLQSKH